MLADFDLRMNRTVRDFVKAMTKLSEEYRSFKNFTNLEQQILERVVQEKDKTIEYQQVSVEEYKLALRIPRHHYKHIEKLKMEELAEQRKQIVKRMKKQYGIDPTKTLLKMPDPSLPPAVQLEMMEQEESNLGNHTEKPKPKMASEQAA